MSKTNPQDAEDMKRKIAMATAVLEECTKEIRRLKAVNAGHVAAMKESLALLQKGAPGWGVAKDILNAEIHAAEAK